MIKKLSVLALAGCLLMPLAAVAASNADLEERIEELETQLEEKGEAWDLSSRISWSGDIRSRGDFAHTADTADYYKATDLAKGANWFLDTDTLNAGMVDNPNTVAGSMGSMYGSGNLLKGFFMQEMGLPDAQAAGGAAQQLSMLIFGNPTTITVTNPGDAATGVPATFAVGAGTELSATQQKQNLIALMDQFTPVQRAALFSSIGYNTTAAAKYENDSLYTTRLRLNMRAKATENVEVKVRLVGYKVWGMQDSATPETDEDGIHDTDSPYFLNSRSFDGTAGRQPSDNSLIIDRAFMNWNNIAGLPMWFSIGRRPTTDGPPAHLRMGLDKRMATPVNYMDYPFDGVSLGYAYALPMDMDGSGRIRLCYGRGFESGPTQTDTGMNDVDFGGLSWDVMKSGNRFMNIQSFAALNLFNVPGDTYFPNPYELADEAEWSYDNPGVSYGENGYLDRMNMGNIYHTSAVYMDKIASINYFITGGWSRTDAKGIDELGVSLLSDNWSEPENKDGYGVYVGGRYDLDDLGLRLGLEYNWGSKNWLAFTPGHDDMYSSKLQTRGSVYEAYLVYDLPGGEAISKYGKAFMRLGYQYYDYEYTYSGMWLGTPNKIDDIKNDPMMAQFYAPIDKMQQVYLTFEAYF